MLLQVLHILDSDNRISLMAVGEEDHEKIERRSRGVCREILRNSRGDQKEIARSMHFDWQTNVYFYDKFENRATWKG